MTHPDNGRNRESPKTPLDRDSSSHHPAPNDVLGGSAPGLATTGAPSDQIGVTWHEDGSSRERGEPCPTCGAFNGFHDDGPHADAAARIPRHLVHPEKSEPVRRGCLLDHPHDGPHQIPKAAA